ncbi:MAG: hypothetical protein ABIW46_03765, partial [Acidimicrobiales bacterium]
VHDGAVAVTVHGVSGYVAPMPLFQAVSSKEWGHIVTWRDVSGMLVEVAARGASAADAVGVAELVTVDGNGHPVLPRDALGPDTSPIHEGAGIIPYPVGLARWLLQYRPGDIGEAEHPGFVMVRGQTVGPGDLEALRFWAVTAQPATVRGHEGLEYTAFDADRGPFGIAWEEAPGFVVQLVGSGIDRDEVRRLAQSLESVEAARWKAVKRQATEARCEGPRRPS